MPPGLNEMEVSRLMLERAEADGRYLNFIGAGAYEHHIPAAVWQITTRGEFYSSYTPYQAEASQGTLQLLYEYQTMMASLTGMDVSNASMYDGASALAEAALMAVRSHKSSRRILMPATVHPIYRSVVRAIVKNQGIDVVELPYCKQSGQTLLEALDEFGKEEFAALVIPAAQLFRRARRGRCPHRLGAQQKRTGYRRSQSHGARHTHSPRRMGRKGCGCRGG